MHPSLFLTLTIAATPLLATYPRAALGPRAEEKTTLNDIDTLCSINFGGDPHTIICLKDGTSTTFTTRTSSYLRNNDDSMCCEADNTCMLSNHTVVGPRAACYDPKTKRATIAQDGGPCELNAAGDGCKWTGTNRGESGVFSTKGVTKVTAVVDGKAVLGGTGGAGGGGSSGTSGVAGVNSRSGWVWAMGGAGVWAVMLA
ncbi:hypothetical protein B0H67DRAFT_640601 [Lasiosphaeris hirsuta]|uniref:Uncharacterized protein n=1 Tax=Lasiosphaeris hirsuta TaxID=260670 RepID=A0AA40BDM9_9PEZI|nr:hypothetical protein B0H67DRAFT_640601 [Lasiosphaeris hirsuta]